MSASTKYPFRYGREWRTWDEMMEHSTVNQLHPELLRRFHALIEQAAAEGVALGIGTGWRVQPDPPPPGFAQPGNSNHEGFTPGNTWAVAIDTVPNTGWSWMERNCAAYGLRTFTHVNNEPWHVQPSDIPASRRWRKERWKLAPWPLPGTPTPPQGDDVHPSLCSRWPGQLDMFATGADGALWHRWYDADVDEQNWSEWQYLGGALVGPPTATAWGPNRLDVAAVGVDGNIWKIAWVGDTWTPWQSLGDNP